jgi:hypothetical protein
MGSKKRTIFFECNISKGQRKHKMTNKKRLRKTENSNKAHFKITGHITM